MNAIADVANAGVCFLVHYIEHGSRRGPPTLTRGERIFRSDASRFAAEKETIILVSHEASRTGAPMVALNIAQRLCEKYNIVTVLLRGGGLIDNFEKISAHLICLEDKHRHQAEFKYVVNAIVRERPIRFAIVSSIACWDFIHSLGAAFVPTVTLIHEFASYMRPIGATREALGWVTEPVFSSEITAELIPRRPSGASTAPGTCYPPGPVSASLHADYGGSRARAAARESCHASTWRRGGFVGTWRRSGTDT